MRMRADVGIGTVEEWDGKNAKKDGVGRFEPEQIRFIVQGELEYCDSIELFD